jgi:hypothetical protein
MLFLAVLGWEDLSRGLTEGEESNMRDDMTDKVGKGGEQGLASHSGIRRRIKAWGFLIWFLRQRSLQTWGRAVQA